MSGGRLFRAPGKVVLLGEYAVLDGAPAIVAAVDRGVQVRVLPAATLQIETPDDDRFVRAALIAAEAPPALYAFSDWNPPKTATKAGLGGSAAATVAAVLAARALQGRSTTPDDLYAIAAPVHHAVQGSGSGIDVAASAWGGVVRFQAGRVVPMPVPEHLVVVWSGGSAKTGPRVERYLAFEDRGEFARRSTLAVERFATDPIQALRDMRQNLEAMAAAAGIEYRTKGLVRIAELAEARRGGAKASGAGGGDVAVAILPDADHERTFREACAAHGLPVLEVAIAPGAHEVG